MNFLVVTPYYPVLDNPKLNNQTRVVHYFTQNWVKQGHQVLVIHTYPHKLANTANIPKVLSSLKVKKAKLKEADGIKVAMIEWYRWKPGSFQLMEIQKKNTISFICDAVRQWGIIPDRIICHFPGACMWLMKVLKKYYECPQIAMFHNIDLSLMKSEKSFSPEEYRHIYSALGFRSLNILKEFKAIKAVELPTFVANSGIPEDILRTTPPKYISRISTLRLVFVGRLDRNKNVETVLYVLANLQNKIDFEFSIIGEGPSEKFLKKLTYKLGLEKRVNFSGQLKRRAVFEELSKSDVFVMVSHRETLGLAYLEAMACGCIVVGSIGTGIDGIVKNGENGFLVTSYDQHQLCQALETIYHMQPEEINQVLLNSFNTIHKYTDQKMADSYLNNLINIE